MAFTPILVSPEASPTRAIVINSEWLSFLLGLALPFSEDSNWGGSDTDAAAAAEFAEELIELLMTDQPSLGGVSMPIGAVIPWAGASLPSNFLLCDGTQYAKSAYPALYDALDSAFIVDANNFIVPDMRGRFALGVNDSHLMGAIGGAENHQLTEAEMPSHTHEVGDKYAPTNPTHYTYVGSGSWAVRPYVTTAAGGNQAHNNMPPYLVLKWVIIADE